MELIDEDQHDPNMSPPSEPKLRHSANPSTPQHLNPSVPQPQSTPDLLQLSFSEHPEGHQGFSQSPRLSMAQPEAPASKLTDSATLDVAVANRSIRSMRNSIARKSLEAVPNDSVDPYEVQPDTPTLRPSLSGFPRGPAEPVNPRDSKGTPQHLNPSEAPRDSKGGYARVFENRLSLKKRGEDSVAARVSLEKPSAQNHSDYFDNL